MKMMRFSCKLTWPLLLDWPLPLLLPLLLTLLSLQTQAKTDLSGLALSADNMSRDSQQGIVTLEGQVQVVFQRHYLSADKAIIRTKNKTIVAEGNVILQNPEVYAEAKKIVINYEDQTGTLYDAFVQSGQVVFEGLQIKKTGDKDYIVNDGQYTACTTCPGAWSFSGKTINAELGGYADIDFPVFRIAGVPVLILPRIIVPLKSKRQTGLLTPGFGLGSKSGVSWELSHFWAISRSTDFTTTMKWYKERGLKALGEYRFVLSKDSSGELKGAYMRDQLFREDLTSESSGYNSSERGRGFLSYRHYFVLPNDYIQRLQLNHISDLRYPRDFSDEIGGHGAPALENRVSISKNFRQHHLSSEAVVYHNMLQADALANNRNAVHRFPNFRYDMIDRRLFGSGLLTGLNFDYVNFSRNNFSYDDVLEGQANCDLDGDGDDSNNPERCVADARDGDFDPNTDLIRTGDRIKISPHISWPFQLGKSFDVVPSVKYSETQYRFDARYDGADPSVNYSPTAARRYIETDLLVRTTLSKVFGDSKLERGNLYKHEIVPSLQYSSIPWHRRPNHPFFGNFEEKPYRLSDEQISNQDFFGTNKVQFDYKDRVFDKRLVEFGVANYITKKKWSGNAPTYNRVVTFKLTQSYDLDEASRTDPRPWSSVNGLLNLKFVHLDAHVTANYVPEVRDTSSTARIRLKDSVGNFTQLSYNHSFKIAEDNSNTVKLSERTITWGLGAGVVTKYFNLQALINYSAITYNVQSWSYTSTLKPPGRCWSIIFGQRQQLTDPDIITKANFEFDYDGGF